MRDIGVFTSKPVQTAELIEFVESYSSRIGQPCTRREGETVVGRPPDFLWVFDGTAPTDGYFDEEEFQEIESKLGSPPKSYVDIHFTSSDGASALAGAMAQEIKQRWEGIIDYRGAGGQLGVPPDPARSGDGSDRC